MLEAVGMNEINKVFAVTDALGIHREKIVIPLGTGPGRVRRLLNGKLEIVVDAETPIDERPGGRRGHSRHGREGWGAARRGRLRGLGAPRLRSLLGLPGRLVVLAQLLRGRGRGPG